MSQVKVVIPTRKSLKVVTSNQHATIKTDNYLEWTILSAYSKST